MRRAQEFYQKRTATKNASIKEHREAHKLLGDQASTRCLPPHVAHCPQTE